VIAEVSSFQLEWVEQFRPRIGLWLNLTEDHLDRHGTLAAYGAAKRAMFERQTSTDWMIINRHDSAVQNFTQGLPGRLVSFGWQPVTDGVWIEGENQALVGNVAGREIRISLAGLQLYGRHNLENVMAAVAAAVLWGVLPDVIERVLARFTGLRHRLELVANKQGVLYFDDSKGTNVGAVVQSLASFAGPVILLAGGVDKGGDYSPLRPLLQNKVKKLILFGAAKDIIAGALKNTTDTLIVETLAEAVQAAARAACVGDTVLLSPACASFDQFRNYAHRGEVFRVAVETL
jgi:UDP-N-acetylmuramoylalanine--D-glutamate ligase